MNLGDLQGLMARRRAGSGLSLSEFCADPLIAALRWPEDVVEQWLYDHGDNGAFQRDYGHVDLARIAWSLEPVTATELCGMPTGASDDGCIDYYAENPDYWAAARSSGAHEGVARCWAEQGTWTRPPVLLDRALVYPEGTGTGLQVVEGRTRVGVLRGRSRQGSLVAAQHQAWVGRPAPVSARSSAPRGADRLPH
ncbi:hypothetical protein [Streptomyces sp. CBMA156]|uniref:hypothetical protein n=1 Tax=Streptomyces sp. CBMA156 TaxID=1930280 RepID=UPI001661F0A5|nr:hypothetical protein [Streptomyces sp. CBMA156]MBD0675672.1 hypothetical protein [Streptomyces sp. CBMA156]